MTDGYIIAAQPLQEGSLYAASGQLWRQKHFTYYWKHTRGAKVRNFLRKIKLLPAVIAVVHTCLFPGAERSRGSSDVPHHHSYERRPGEV